MDEFVIRGLVLQEIEYGESDRILKILTAEKGLITAFAKNSMRLTSHLFAACGQLCYSEFVLRPGRNTEDRMYTVVEAGYEDDFRNIGYSFEAQGVAMYMVEFTLALSLADQPAEKELKLLMNCLYKICQQKTDPKLVKAVFELRRVRRLRRRPVLPGHRGRAAALRQLRSQRGQSLQLGQGRIVCGAVHLSGRGQADLRFPHFGRQRAAAVCRGGAVRPGPYGQAPEFVKVFAVPPGVGPGSTTQKGLNQWRQVT